MTLCNTAKPSSEILTGYWHRNVLHFAAEPRIIGKKMRGGTRHDLQDDREKADRRSLCFCF